MGAHMKTTIEIADDLFEKARRQARREGKTLRQVVEQALRRQLAAKPAEPFRLKRHPFAGKGVQGAIVEGQWDAIRDLIYRLG